MAEPKNTILARLLAPTSGPGAVPPGEKPAAGIIQSGEDQIAAATRSMTEQYQRSQSQQFTRSDFLPPIEERKNVFVDLPNLLLGTEMSAVGVSLDEEGFKWQLETFKDAWSEHPVRTGVTLAMDMLPALGALHKSLRATKLAGIPDFELKPFVDKGLELSQLSKKEQELIRINAYPSIRRKELEQKVLGGTASLMEKAHHSFNKRWANQYLDIMDPSKPLNARAEHYNRMQSVIKGAEINKHLEDLPPESMGPAVTRYYKDENALSKIPAEYRPWAIRMKSQGRKLMDNMESEGFTTTEERAKAGDVWFSLVRRGTPVRHEGTDISLTSVIRGKDNKVKLVGIPRTESVHLLKRKTGLGEADRMIDRTEALDLLKDNKITEAAKLLHRAEDAPILGLVKKGATEEAKAALIKTNEIVDISTSDLTVKNLLQQHLLFENFRYIRDMALNPTLTKTLDEFNDMAPSARREWMNLEHLPNAHIVRRMVGKKLGKEHQEPLGFIRGEIFKELTNVEVGQPGMLKGMANLIDWQMAMHKTAKTALNLPTQLQNIAGNVINMAWAGMNPFSRESFNLIKTSFNAAWKKQKARKGVGELGDLGKIKSHVGGADIDIAEEFQSGVLSELMDESTFGETEGLGSMKRLLDATSDTQVFMKGLLEWTQRAAKARIGPISIENASDAYTTVDSAFKLAYFLNLRQRGLSGAGAVMEVARRFPIYHTVSPIVKGARRVIYPWLSFPVETARIVKNNVTDYPLRMAMYLHGAEFLQSMMYPWMEQSAEGIKDTIRNLPTWAQKPNTVITPFRDRNDDIRAMVLDWLPQASFLPQSYAPEAPMAQKIPAGLGQPIPILQGLMHAFTGKDAFGNDMPHDPSNPAQLAGAMAMSLINTITPPLVGKYLSNPTAPDPTYRLRQEFGQAINPATGKPGDTMFDFVLNNIGMPGKFYPASGEQYLANQSLQQRGIESYRGSLSKKWGAYVKSGDWERAAEVSTQVQETFIQQWKDPAIAQQKFSEWLKRHQKGLDKHPQLKDYSKEQIDLMISQAGNDSAITRSNAARSRLAVLRSEAAARGFTSNSGSSNPLTGKAFSIGSEAGGASLGSAFEVK
jgi:hypothetical protein